MSQITTAKTAYLRELSADIAANGGIEDGGMNRIARFFESWTFVALCWAGLIAFVVFGGAQ